MFAISARWIQEFQKHLYYHQHQRQNLLLSRAVLQFTNSYREAQQINLEVAIAYVGT